MGVLLLIAESNATHRRDLVELCRARGDDVVTAESRAELETRWRESDPYAVLLGADFLEERDLTPAPDRLATPLVLLAPAAPADPDLSRGLADLLVHPVTAPHLALCLERLARLRSLAGERDELRAGPATGARDVLAGPSSAAVRLRELARRVASTPLSTVLVTGEAGVEKEHVARAIHALSARAAGPFRVHACGGEEPADLRAALFGGGSDAGLVPQTAGGTLFLEEVSALAPEAQDLLTTLLRDRAYAGEEGGPERALEARIIASTRFDLEARTDEGRFRGDLYYRLNVLTVPVPSLRERLDDLPELTRQILRRLPIAAPRGLPALSAGAQRRLAAHDWPGNLRELRATLERAAFAARGEEIHAGHLGLDSPRSPEDPLGSRDPAALGLPRADRSLRAMEEGLIRRVLAEEDGNRSRAARVLGINRSTLYNKLRQYGIE